MDQTQKNEPLKPPRNWPFKWVNGVDTAEFVVMHTTKEPKSKIYEAVADMEDALF